LFVFNIYYNTGNIEKISNSVVCSLWKDLTPSHIRTIGDYGVIN